MIVATLVAAAVAWGAAVAAFQWWLPAWNLAEAKRALSRRDVTAAIALLEQVERTQPRSAEVAFLQARAQRRAGRIDLMDERLQRANELGWPAAKLSRERTLATAQVGQLGDGREAFRKLILESNDDVAEVCEAFVNGNLRTYRLAEALAIVDAWHADLPNDPQPHLVRGSIEWQRSNAKLAATHFQEALRRDATRLDVRLHLAEALAAQREFPAAIREYRAVLKTRPSNVDALIGMADALWKLPDAAGSIEAYERLRRAAPDDPHWRFGLGRAAYNAGRGEEAIRWLEEAYRRAPAAIPLRYTLAQALLDAGRVDEAQGHLDFVERATRAQTEKAAVLNDIGKRPNDAGLRYRAGAITMEYGDSAEAIAWLHSALALRPNFPEVRRLLVEHYAKSSRPDLAEAYRDPSDSTPKADSTPQAVP